MPVRLYSNNNIQSANFIENTTPAAQMRMYSNSNVEIVQIVEISGSQNRLFSNGTFVSSQFIEV